jgi:hypothetical protein
MVARTGTRSAAMGYCENLVGDQFASTDSLIGTMMRRGTAPFRVRARHCFIGEPIVTRNKVLSPLHPLDLVVMILPLLGLEGR